MTNINLYKSNIKVNVSFINVHILHLILLMFLIIWYAVYEKMVNMLKHIKKYLTKKANNNT
jgi:hypothetical protein